jgi:hypothetical protein
MKKNIIVIFTSLLISFLFTSCAIKVSFKGLYSYYERTKKESPNLLHKVNNPETICNIKTRELNPKILVINGTQLKNCIDKNRKTLIYIWGPKCRSQMCSPPEIAQSTCDINNIELYIVSEYYDSEKMNENYNISRYIFGIDTLYYKTSLTTKYVSLFLLDLGVVLKKDDYNRFLYFENGKFIKSYESVYDIEN